MREVFGQYGGSVIAVTVALALFGILRGGGAQGNFGFFGIAGSSGIFGAAESEWSSQLSQENVSISCESLGSFYRRQPPELRYRKDNPIRQNSRARLEEHFSAADAEGRSVPFEILALSDGDGTPCTPERTAGGTYVTFKHAGVCYARFRVRDGGGRNRVFEISFPVQEE